MADYISMGYDSSLLNAIVGSQILLKAQKEANLLQPLEGYSDEIMQYAPNLIANLTSINYNAQEYNNTVNTSEYDYDCK